MHIIWQERFNTGVDIVDQQHRHLIDLLNQHFCDEAHLGLLNMFNTLADFNAYANLHFDTEQRLVTEASLHESSLWLIHESEHDYYRQRIGEFEKLAQSEPNSTASRLISFLRFWWLDHIQVNDKKLMRSILDQEIQT